MRQLKFLALLIVAGFILSCKKYSGPTTAQGQVVNAITLKGIPHAEVWLMRDKGSSAMARTHMETQNSDQNGNFSFTVETESDYRYFLDAAAEHYFTDAEGGYIRAGEKNENMQIKITPRGYVKFKIINEEPKESIDLSINILNNGIFGLNNDTTIYGSYFGGQTLNLTWWINDKGEMKKYDDSIYIPALDTVEFIIKY